MAFDVSTIRRQFPFLETHPGMAYLDNAATTQQPQSVIDVVRDAATHGLGGIHRGLHPLADVATDAFEKARAMCAAFLGAAHADEIIFTSGTTMSLNLLAHSLGERWGENDAIVLTTLEHHSNIAPWLALSERRGVDVRWIGITPDGQLKQEDIDAAFRDDRVRLLSMTGQSNVLGVRPDLPSLIATARKHGALVSVDAAQMAGHGPIDVTELDCDFLACSGHKFYGPTGIGLLYGKRELLSGMPPFMTGGGMVRSVTQNQFVPADSPTRFEAGSPNILGAIGLAAAIDWQKDFAWNARTAHERMLLALLISELRSVDGVNILGPADDTIRGCVSFTVDGVHPHDVAEVLGSQNVCVRAGHQCTEPLHKALGIEASVRASVAMYTNEDDVKKLAPAIHSAQKILSRA